MVEAGTKEPKPEPCGQCGKPGVVSIEYTNLCVSCWYEYEVARTLSFRLAAIGMNNASDEMDFAMGFRNFSPRIQVPDIPEAPMHFHNIKIDNSVVGVINTAQAGAIDVNITYIKQGGNEDLANALTSLTEAITNTLEANESVKKDLLDQVAFLSEQVTIAIKDRKPGVIKSTIEGIKAVVEGYAALKAAWDLAAPLLKTHFGI